MKYPQKPKESKEMTPRPRGLDTRFMNPLLFR